MDERFTMDYGFGASRMRGIEDCIQNFHPAPWQVDFEVQGGWKLEAIRQRAITKLDNVNQDLSNCHVYVMAGLPDILQRDKFWWSPGVPYEECYITRDTKEIILSVMHSFELLECAIILRGAKPIFSTIAPASIESWNNTRLEQGKTQFLLHSHQYPDMQQILDDAIHDINLLLIQKNMQNSAFTPQIAKLFQTYKGRHSDDKRCIRTHFSRLIDGVHPNAEYAAKSGVTFWKSLKLNRHYK